MRDGAAVAPAAACAGCVRVGEGEKAVWHRQAGGAGMEDAG